MRCAAPTACLDLARRFTLFDLGIKKVARYQQFFAVKNILARVKQRDAEGRRQGGVIWHTQGSGKSLTMVMLARGLALDTEIVNPAHRARHRPHRSRRAAQDDLCGLRRSSRKTPPRAGIC